MSLAEVFPREIFLIVVSYLDYDDLPTELSQLRTFWLRHYNFQVLERNKEEDNGTYHITTTIDLDEQTVPHSIDDQPCFVIARVPLATLKALPAKEQTLDPSITGYSPEDSWNDHIELEAWGKFGLLDRAGGNKPARFEQKEDTCGYFLQFYFSKGIPYRPNNGAVFECVGSGCGGTFANKEWFLPHSKKRFKVKTKWNKGCYESGEFDLGYRHNLHGPAVMSFDSYEE